MRSGKFYYKNEREVMESLGMKQVPGSGNGWVSKEDGENEHVLCQLKSTDAKSISIKKHDIDKLEYNANVSNKIPVFAIQFLSSGETYILVKPEYLRDVSEYLKTNEYKPVDKIEIDDVKQKKPKSVVKSDENAREYYRKKMAEKYSKEKSAK